ncbi:hypothetical protein GCM10009839_82640 [Catenulispora yoronensis]|uniref:Uncharacterized protein n=1 Tax=Catenulispora yoronensis TaxID=450799 RepID=A0ABN2VDL1_9ACTN
MLMGSANRVLTVFSGELVRNVMPRWYSAVPAMASTDTARTRRDHQGRGCVPSGGPAVGAGVGGGADSSIGSDTQQT